MVNISVNFNEKVGKIKPMHAVNNGPVCKVGEQFQGWNDSSNLGAYAAAGIPYARTHDAAFYDMYGGEHTVDVGAIFTDFDADPEDPASYDFVCTDNYMQMIEMAGTKVFYRLGNKIEHTVKKFGTLPPKDFKKWAVICEHIIRHYTEGWGNGFHMDIQYWEIWNEPDLDPDDSDNKRTWGGTKAEFFELYHIAATHLKEKFPHLKIGGPAIAGKMDWAEDFLAQLKAPLDFFSWHIYAHEAEKVASKGQKVRQLLDKYGFTATESILNEWNYVLGWDKTNLRYSQRMQQGLKGAAFNLATMSLCQHGTVDMLMYYDARPSTWNGLFDHIDVSMRLKAYYSLFIFNELYKLKNAARVQTVGENGYAVAAVNANEAAVTLCHYDDNDDAASKTFAIDLSGFAGEHGTELEIYLLDDTHDLALVDTFTFFGDRLLWEKELPVNTCYLLKLKKK
ncbi:MAG: hypothetical protein IJX39_02420 [Clostridia bacterium]|nr:hypothetical protein [Clostridia bacterium]